MIYTSTIEPFLIILISFSLGLFIGFIISIFKTSIEQNELEKNIIEFDNKINKFESERKQK
tara:strand:- start:1719 stop:1901 length:183 start_codon:yes stop_codon:yes gene_type:complete